MTQFIATIKPLDPPTSQKSRACPSSGAHTARETFPDDFLFPEVPQVEVCLHCNYAVPHSKKYGQSLVCPTCKHAMCACPQCNEDYYFNLAIQQASNQ